MLSWLLAGAVNRISDVLITRLMWQYAINTLRHVKVCEFIAMLCWVRGDSYNEIMSPWLNRDVGASVQGYTHDTCVVWHDTRYSLIHSFIHNIISFTGRLSCDSVPARCLAQDHQPRSWRTKFTGVIGNIWQVFSTCSLQTKALNNEKAFSSRPKWMKAQSSGCGV